MQSIYTESYGQKGKEGKTNIKQLLCFRHCAKCRTNIFSFDPHHKPVSEVLLLSLPPPTPAFFFFFFLQLRKRRQADFKLFVQGHKARKCLRLNLNSVFFLTPGIHRIRRHDWMIHCRVYGYIQILKNTWSKNFYLNPSSSKLSVSFSCHCRWGT